MNYEDLKQLKQQIKVPVKDLIALSPNNDPFHLADARQRSGEWFKRVWHGGQFQKVHIRRVHYWLVSQKEPFIMRDGKPYLNTNECWGKLCDATKSARYMDLVPIDAFIDKRNPPAIVYEDDSEKRAGDIHRWASEGYISFYSEGVDIGSMPGLPHAYVLPPDVIQRYQVEIWCEKSTMNDVLNPICRQHRCNLITGLGELSVTAVDLLFNRIKQSGKPTRILYISDFDPAGKSMPVAVSRKAEFMAQDHDVDLVIDSIVLTEGQCIEFDLPRTPIKESELRKQRFEDSYGAGATELDALEALYPGALRKIVTDAVLRYRDTKLRKWINDICRDANETAGEDQRRAYEKFADEITAAEESWEQVAEDMDAVRNAWKEKHQQLWKDIAKEMSAAFHMECPETEYADTPDDVLFDSSRTYLQQMDSYRKFQMRPALNLAGLEDEAA